MAIAKKPPMQAATAAQGSVQRTPRERPAPVAPAKSFMPSGTHLSKTLAPAKPAKPAKTAKPVRDRYTLPAADYAVLVQLKARSAALGQRAKKNQILRAGVLVLAAMGNDALLEALRAAPPRAK